MYLSSKTALDSVPITKKKEKSSLQEMPRHCCWKTVIEEDLRCLVYIMKTTARLQLEKVAKITPPLQNTHWMTAQELDNGGNTEAQDQRGE